MVTEGSLVRWVVAIDRRWYGSWNFVSRTSAGVSEVEFSCASSKP